MNIAKLSIAACALAAAAASYGQTISTEITLDRVVEPEQRPAVRPQWMPASPSLPMLSAEVYPVEYTGSAAISTISPLMQAPQWANRVGHTPYRGYASVGYFPTLNIGANAGYRFVDTRKVVAGAWAQYDGDKYKRLYSMPANSNAYSTRLSLSRQDVKAGAYASYAPNDFSSFDASASYLYSAVGRPSWISSAGDYVQRAQQADAALAWKSVPGPYRYSIAADLRHFAFGSCPLGMQVQGAKLECLRQTAFGASFSGGLLRDGYSSPWLGIDAKVRILASGDDGIGTIGEYSANPYGALTYGAFSARIGAVVSFASGTTPFSSRVHVAPDVRADWMPSSLPLSAYVRLGGGEQLVELADVYAANPYCAPALPYTRTNREWSIDGGINIGPQAGLSVQVYGSVARDANRYLPVFSTNGKYLPVWASGYGGTMYSPFSFTSWMAGAKARYAYASLFTVSAGAEFGGSGHDGCSWTGWLDRAKASYTLEATAAPIANLDVQASYVLRTGRHGFFRAGEEVDLGNASLLSIGASYALSPQLTVFLRAENVLCSRFLMVSGLPCQSIKGLAGVAYKF